MKRLITIFAFVLCSPLLGQEAIIARFRGTSTLAPTTAVLDNFNRTNENPLSDGGKWTNQILGLGGNCRTFTNIAGAATAPAGCAWTNASFGPNYEVYVTLTTVPSSGNEVDFSAVDSSSNGYGLAYENTAGGTWTLLRYDAATPVVVGTPVTGVALANGNGIWFVRSGNALTGYKGVSGVWTQVITGSDSNYTTNPNIGLLFGDATARVDDFGGGTLP